MLKGIIYKARTISSDKFIIQSIKTMILRLLGVVMLFGFTFFITNTYPAKIVGQYDFVRSFLLVVGSICILGTDQSILYFSGKLKSSNSIYELKDIYKKMLCIIFSVSLFFFLLLLLIGRNPINTFFEDEAVYPIIFKSTAVLFFNGLTLFNTELFRALGFTYLSELFRNTIKYVPVIIGAVVLLVINMETYLVDCYIYGFVILGIITTFMAFFYLNKMEHSGSKPTVSIREIVITSYPIAISGMAIFLLMSIDIMFLKKYLGNEAVAYYGVAVKLMTILSVVMVTVNITLSTRIAELYTRKEYAELKKALRNASRLVLLLTSPAAVLICLFPEMILHLFGPQYTQAKTALVILIAGQWLCSYFGVVTIYLNMTMKQHYFQYILIIAVVINFVLNRLLIPVYGMTGGAVSFVASALFWNVTSAVVIYRTDKINLFWNTSG